MLWEELRQDEFAGAIESSKGVCVLPIGCVESHGIHLPLACDVMHVTHHAKLAAQREPVVVFPSIYFGEKAGAGEYPGTIIFPESLIQEILEQCCKEIYRNGFKKIIILNGHGGNTSMLNNFARSSLLKKAGYIVFVASAGLFDSSPSKILNRVKDFPYLTAEDIQVLMAYTASSKKDGHGGFIETGWLLDARADLVRVDLMGAKSGKSTHAWDEFSKRKIYSPFGWMANYPDSLDCDYHEGLNERIARAMTELAVENVADIFAFIKNENISEKYYESWAAKNPLI